MMGMLYKHRGCRSLVAACCLPYRSNASKDWLIRRSTGEMQRPEYGQVDKPWCPDCEMALHSVSHWCLEPFDPRREFKESSSAFLRRTRVELQRPLL